MNSREFFSTVVCPTIDDYLASPKDLRLALLSCIALVHIHDYLKFDKVTSVANTKDFFLAEGAQCPVLWAIYDVAIAAKHVVVSASGFSVAQIKSRAAAKWGEATWGESIWGDEHGGVNVARDSGDVRLELALPSARDYFYSSYPSLGQSSAS